jgi:hypothetical protein
MYKHNGSPLDVAPMYGLVCNYGLCLPAPRRRVSINGTQVFGPSDFNSNTTALDRSQHVSTGAVVGILPDGVWTPVPKNHVQPPVCTGTPDFYGDTAASRNSLR